MMVERWNAGCGKAKERRLGGWRSQRIERRTKSKEGGMKSHLKPTSHNPSKTYNWRDGMKEKGQQWVND